MDNENPESGKYLMIRNPGIADHRGFTLLGVSTTRNANLPGTVGMFGSGSKLSLALLLREGIEPVICCGNLKMTFFIKEEIVKSQVFRRVCVKYAGKDLDGVNRSGTEDLGFTLEWGVQDWDRPTMAFREFISNAIDGSIIAGGSHKAVQVEVVDSPRAKSGCTCVYLPYSHTVQKMWDSLHSMFLHFSNPELLESVCLPKRFPEDDNVLIYKKGVLVCAIRGKSVFDYNLGNELVLDESRNANEWHVKHAIAKRLQDETPENLAVLMSELAGNAELWEAGLDNTYLGINNYESEEKRTIKRERFKAAWNSFAGATGVCTNGIECIDAFVRKKGFHPIGLPNNWYKALQSFGVANDISVLSVHELTGKEVLDATPEMVAGVAAVWKLLESFSLTAGKEMPAVKSFNSIMDGESQTFGYFIPGGSEVFLHSTLSGKQLFQTALEECVHFCTGSVDGSRDLQDFLFRLVTEMAY